MATSLYQYFRITNKYFQIPIIHTLNTRIEGDNCGFVTPNNNEYPGICCIGNEWDNSTISISYWRGGPRWDLRFGNAYKNFPNNSITLGEKYSFSLSKTRLQVGNYSYNVNATVLSDTSKLFTIGGRNDTNTSNVIWMMDGWVGDFRIYDDGVLVMELKPAIKDGDYCYYDTIVGGYYYAQGSGTIEACEPIAPPAPTPTDLVIGNKTVDSINIGGKDVVSIYDGATLLWEKPVTPQPTPPSLSDCVCFEALDANTSIRLHASQDYSFFPVNLWYSTDGGTTFSKMDRLTPITLPNIGDKMYVYGSNVSLGQSNLNYVRFLIYDGDVSVSGDLTRLLNPNGLTTLPDYAFVNTFSNNTHLADVSGLTIPATTVGKSSLAGLFYGCSNITTSPTLQATTLGEGCYEEMFYGCSNLNYIKVGATTWNTSWANNWVNSVAATGTFVKPVDLTIGTGTGEIPSDSVNGIPIGWTVQNTNDYLCFTAEEANATIGMEHFNTNQTTTQPVLYYSTDKTNWTLWDFSTITLQNVGDKVYFYGDNPNGICSGLTSSEGYSIFRTTKTVACSGDIMTLLNVNGGSVIPNNYCFSMLFESSKITTPPELPATTITEHCYRSMFKWCYYLTTAPVLPATIVPYYAYCSMFYQCTSLNVAPELPATTLSTQCYSRMFEKCSNLTTGPSVLPATTLTNSCYENMFQDTSITTAPVLPATTLAQSCYVYMFYGCTSLNSITCLATDITANHCTLGWMDGVSATGTFTKNPNMSNWTTGVDGIPTGWTVTDAQ